MKKSFAMLMSAVIPIPSLHYSQFGYGINIR